jgi:hypothetical protein
MGWRPYPRVNHCPACGRRPIVRCRLFRGWRAECRCGVAGPFVADDRDPERAAMLAWAAVAGEPKPLRPPPPSWDH